MVLEATKRNHNVVFWASTFQHNIKKQRFESYKEIVINENVKVNFVPAKDYEKNISFRRMFSHYHLSKALINRFKQEQQLPDVIVIAFPPISTAYEIVKWAAKRSIPVIIDIIDPWPEVFLNHSTKVPKAFTKIGLLPLKNKATIVLKNTKAIMAISKQYIDWAKTYNPSIKNQACFYPAVQLSEMQNQLKNIALENPKKNDVLNIVYAGSLGFSYDIPTILKAAEILETKCGNAIAFGIAGEGPQRHLIEEYISNHNNLTYYGRLPKEKLMEVYYKADIGLTQHIKGATQSVTYKLFDLLGCGLPIMNSLDSEMKDIILNENVGFYNTPGDSEQLAENILKCYNDRKLLATMTENALALVEKEGDAAMVYKKALDYIESQVK